MDKFLLYKECVAQCNELWQLLCNRQRPLHKGLSKRDIAMLTVTPWRWAFPYLLESTHLAVYNALAACIGTLLLRNKKERIFAVDGTCGNGNDTEFLVNSFTALLSTGHQPVRLSDTPEHQPDTPEWQVLAFDVQEEAIQKSRLRLASLSGSSHIHYIPCGHERLREYLPFPTQRALQGTLLHADPAQTLCCPQASEQNSIGRPWYFAAAMYNLGYLPGSDKQTVTMAHTSLLSFEVCREYLAAGGLLAVHAYAGHTGGAEELAAVEDWFAQLNYPAWRVARYAICNKPRNPEVVFLAQKAGS